VVWWGFKRILMDDATKTHAETTRDFHTTITWILVGGLFLLRIPIETGISIFLPSEKGWAGTVFDIGTYLIIAIAIWWEREHLSDYHINKLALAIIILGKPLEVLLYQLKIPFDYPSQNIMKYWLYLPISLALVMALFIKRPALSKFAKKDWLWLCIGLLSGLIWGIVSGLLIRNNGAGLGVAYSNSSLSRIFSVPARLLVFLPLQQMFYAGIAEEPFFRGFLWGILRKAGWKEVWIWLTQAGLFWLGHAYFLGKATWSFWLLVPASGLIFGLLAWRSRSISTCMIAHGLANGYGGIVGLYLPR
jgi:membrane protease YdiL (CAAX protease family)